MSQSAPLLLYATHTYFLREISELADFFSSHFAYLHEILLSGVPEGRARPLPGTGTRQSAHQEDSDPTEMHQGLVPQVQFSFVLEIRELFIDVFNLCY